MSEDQAKARDQRLSDVAAAIQSLKITPKPSSGAKVDEDVEHGRRHAFRESAYEAGIAVDFKDRA